MEKLDTTGLYKFENNDCVPYEVPKGNVIMCGIPGAFTPGCTNKHLPGYVDNIDALKEHGIDKVVFVSVNDPIVMDAWNNLHGHPDIDSVGDPLAKFASSLNMAVDYGESFGTRCKRFAMLVVDGQIRLFFEDPFYEGMLKEFIRVTKYS